MATAKLLFFVVDKLAEPFASAIERVCVRSPPFRRVCVATAYQWATGKWPVVHWGDMGRFPLPASPGRHQPVRHLRPGANFGHAVCRLGTPEPALCG